tara:strand:- start:1416 stop:1718 length:303 start_codon:yes stop_codon:yes gene_type:complete
MKRIAIAVIATVFAVSAAYAENDSFFHKLEPCGNCDELFDSIDVGTLVSFTFKMNIKRTIYIGEHCKLDTVILSEEIYTTVTHYSVICVTVKKREREWAR